MRYSKENKTSGAKETSYIRSMLGDEDTDDSLDSSTNEEFQSPDRDVNATDYGFEFTHSNVAIPLENLNDRADETTTTESSLVAKKPPQKAKPKTFPKPVKSVVVDKVSQKARQELTQAQQHLQQRSSANKSPKKAGRQQPRKQLNPMNREKIFWKDVRKLQERRDNILPRLPFSRLVRELMYAHCVEVSKITRSALEALQEASEIYMTQQLQDAYTLTIHRGRVTLSPRDMELLRFIRGRT